jgi:glycosyltransferase involved in cell wall biosynthesis
MASVLLVTNVFPPQIGGPSTFIDRLGHELAGRRGYKVTVVCSSERPAEPSDASRPFRVRRICTADRYQYQLRVRLVLLAELARHAHVLVNGLEEYVYPIARLLGRRYILKVVGDTTWEAARNAGLTHLDIDRFQTDPNAQATFAGAIATRRAYLRQARWIFTPSRYLREMVVKWGVEPDRVVVIPNGMDAGGTPPAEPRRREAGPLRVLFVGRLTNWKGVETLLLALSRMDRLQLTVAGDGPAYPSLEALARQLGVSDRVVFTGRQTDAQVRLLMSDSHVLVLTSLYEGLSHTLIEASAVGLPCIASACGGNPEVITHGETGMLVRAEDVPALCHALSLLEQDEALRLRLAAAARKNAARFSNEKTATEVIRLLGGDAGTD